MLYMANVNKNKFYLKNVTVLFIVYLIFLIFDHFQKHHQLNGIRENNIEAFIFGGSNSLNSLSAHQLTNATGIRFHNASMHNELNSNTSYNNYISYAASIVNRSKVKKVIYSSILPYSNNSIKNYIKDESNLSPKIIPFVSGVSYLKNFFTNQFANTEGFSQEAIQNELILNNFGDYTNPGINCSYDIYKNTFKPESLENSVNFLIDKSFLLATEFPNSEIYIVLPSLYYATPVPDFSIYTSNLKEYFYKYLSLIYPKIVSRVTLVIQPLYPKIDYVCNDPFHSSALGRVWRTNNLLSYIRTSDK